MSIICVHEFLLSTRVSEADGQHEWFIFDTGLQKSKK